MFLTFSSPFGSKSPSLLLPPWWLSQRDAAEHSTGNLLNKALLLWMKETLCAILDLNQNKHPEGIHQRQGCPRFWERAEVDWLWVGIWTVWMIVYVNHLDIHRVSNCCSLDVKGSIPRPGTSAGMVPRPRGRMEMVLLPLKVQNCFSRFAGTSPSPQASKGKWGPSAA